MNTASLKRYQEKDRRAHGPFISNELRLALGIVSVLEQAWHSTVGLTMAHQRRSMTPSICTIKLTRVLWPSQPVCDEARRMHQVKLVSSLFEPWATSAMTWTSQRCGSRCD